MVFDRLHVYVHVWVITPMSVCVCTVSIIHIDTNLGSSVREGAHRASLSAESVTQCQWISVSCLLYDDSTSLGHSLDSVDVSKPRKGSPRFELQQTNSSLLILNPHRHC